MELLIYVQWAHEEGAWEPANVLSLGMWGSDNQSCEEGCEIANDHEGRHDFR